jgi:hypothetical protein
MLLLFGLFMAAIVVYIILVRRKDPGAEKNGAVDIPSDWLTALMDKIDL